VVLGTQWVEKPYTPPDRQEYPVRHVSCLLLGLKDRKSNRTNESISF